MYLTADVNYYIVATGWDIKRREILHKNYCFK